MGLGTASSTFTPKPVVRSGLFGYTNGATIQNLGLSAVHIRGSDYTGALVGDMIGGSITNSYASGAVTGGDRTGGLVGNHKNGTIERSYSAGTVTGDDNVGGLVGYNEADANNTATIQNTYSTASVTGSGSNLGGLVGKNAVSVANSNANILNSYALGAVTGTGVTGMGAPTSNNLGGLVGAHDATNGAAASLSNSYAAGSVLTGVSTKKGALVGLYDNSATITAKNYYVDSAGTNGIVSSTSKTCASTVCIRATGTYDRVRRTWLRDTLNEMTTLSWSNTIWDNFSTGYPCLRDMPAGAPSCPGGFVDVDLDGDGVPDALDVDLDNDGLIEIHDLNMFAAMDNDRDGTHYNDGSTPSNPSNRGCGGTGDTCNGYELTRSLNFANDDSYADTTVKTTWSPNNSNTASATNAGFPGVGPSSGTNGFAAIFEGNGHSITGLYMRSSGNIGLFRRVESTAVIRHMGVVDANVYGGSSGDDIGILVGVNSGTVVASYAKGGSANGGGESW